MSNTYSQLETEEQAPLCPEGLQGLLEVGQMVIHTGNFRHDIIFNARNQKRYEVIDELRKILFYVEQETCTTDKKSLFFKVYNSSKEEVAHILVPSHRICLCLGLSWHCTSLCHFTAVVYSPLGVIVGFIRRKVHVLTNLHWHRKTLVMQEFEVLSPQEDILLRLRGMPRDLQIFSKHLEAGVGRLSVRKWAGVMHEVRRTQQDLGITFPVDMDVRAKCLLLSAGIVLVHIFHK